MKSIFRVLAGLMVIAFALTACIPTAPATPTAPAAPTAAEAEPTAAEAAEPTAAEAAEPTAVEATQPAGEAGGEQQVTLKVWDILTSETENAVIAQLNKEFEEAHPGVTIQREMQTMDQLKATLKLAFSAPDGPDVSQVNQGYPDMGALAAADLLLDLTDVAKEKGWDVKLSPGIVARNSFTPDGKQMGQGNLYGIPITAELVGVFYNREIFEKHGIEIPKTFAEFETILQTLKDAGEVPLNYGSLDGFVNIHLFGAVQNKDITRKYIDDFIYGLEGATFNTPENVAVAQTLVNWVDAGYFTKDFVGIGYDDSVAAFRTGSGAMMITGSWISGDTIAQQPGKFGFFLLPGNNEGDKVLSVGGTSFGFGIRKSSPNRDLAIEYIDWMVSDRAAELWVETGFVPVGQVSKEGDDPLLNDLLKSWQYMTANDLVGHYLDWATPTFYDTLNAAFAELLAKQITPEEAIQKIEDDYSAALSNR